MPPPAQFTMTEGDTAVKTFTASDESAGTVYWQVDNTDFAITDAGVLSFVAAPDYDSATPANNTYDLTITVSDTAFNGDGSIPAAAHTRDVDIQVTVLGIPDITSTTFDIDENGANSGFQLNVVDETPPMWCGCLMMPIQAQIKAHLH